MNIKTTSLATGALLLSAAPLYSQAKDQEQMNVLFIMVDNLKPVLGCFGDSIVITPNIDKLATQGTIFTQSYCQQALSGPSRSSLLTGLRPDNLRIWNMAPIRENYNNALTLPEHFRACGYTTKAVGKIFDQRAVDQNHDTASWDEYITPTKESYHNNAMPSSGYQDPERKKLVRECYLEAKEQGLKGAEANLYVRRRTACATECYDIPDNGYHDGVYANVAVSQLAEFAASDEKFFFGFGLLKPHLPFVAPKKYWDMYDRESLPLSEFTEKPSNSVDRAFSNYKEIMEWADIAPVTEYSDPDQHTIAIEEAKQRELIHGYYAAVSYIDAQVGKVMAALEEYGLADNTVIVLAGDHGWHLGDHGLWAKHTNFEQATNAPLIISSPKIAASTTDQVVEFVDIYPSVCALAGIETPANIDGTNLTPLMIKPNEAIKDVAVSQYNREKGSMGYSLRNTRYRYTIWINHSLAYGSGPITQKNIIGEELYDYIADPLETRNVSDDAEYKEIKRQMREYFDKYVERQREASKIHSENWIKK